MHAVADRSPIAPVQNSVPSENPRSWLAHARFFPSDGTRPPMKTKHRIFTTPVANVYPYYIAKAEKKGRTKAEVDAIFCWQTGYTTKQFEKQLKQETDF